MEPKRKDSIPDMRAAVANLDEAAKRLRDGDRPSGVHRCQSRPTVPSMPAAIRAATCGGKR